MGNYIRLPKTELAISLPQYAGEPTNFRLLCSIEHNLIAPAPILAKRNLFLDTVSMEQSADKATEDLCIMHQ